MSKQWAPIKPAKATRMGEGEYGIVIVKLFNADDWDTLCNSGQPPEFALCRKVAGPIFSDEVRRVLLDALDTHAKFGTPGGHDAYEAECIAAARQVVDQAGK